MTRPSQTYQAYILRLWRKDETAPWRATLVQADNGTQRHFADLQAFTTHLLDQTQKPAGAHSQQPQPSVNDLR
jgi:hypothetical protein